MKKTLLFSALVTLCAIPSVAVDAIYIIGGQGTWVNNQRINTNWDLLAPIEVKAVDGVFTLYCEDCSEICIMDAKPTTDSWEFCDKHRYGPADPVSEKNFGKPMPMKQAKGINFTAWEGNWKLVISQDLQTITYSTDTPRPATKCYLYADQNWDAWCDEKWEFEYEGNGVYWFDCTPDSGTRINATSNLNIMTGTNNSDYSSPWFSSPVRPINVEGVPMTWEYKKGGVSGKSLLAPYSGTVRVVMPEEIGSQNSTIEVTFFDGFKKHESDGSTGVDEFIADDSDEPVVYYNLHGIRIEEPVKGQLVIKRQGGKVTKFIAK